MKHSVLLVLSMLAGCTAQPTVTSWLDPVSVATITSQSTPLVLAHGSYSSTTQRAFAQVSAIEVNRMGARRLYLALVPRITSNVSSTQRATFERSFGEIELRLDDRSLALARYTGNLAELGIGEPALLPLPGVRHTFYEIERADLQALAASTEIALVAMGLGTPRLYEEWNNGRRSLRAFVAQLPDQISIETSNARRGDAP